MRVRNRRLRRMRAVWGLAAPSSMPPAACMSQKTASRSAPGDRSGALLLADVRSERRSSRPCARIRAVVAPVIHHSKPAADIEIDEALIRSLLRAQHPDLADLPLQPMDSGWDNAMFRLGEHLAVRLPRRVAVTKLIEHEQRMAAATRAAVADRGAGAGARRRAGRKLSRRAGASCRGCAAATPISASRAPTRPSVSPHSCARCIGRRPRMRP